MALVAASGSEPAGADPGFSAGQLTAIAEVVQRAVDKAIADRSHREGDGTVPRSSDGASGATPGRVMDPGRGRACRVRADAGL